MLRGSAAPRACKPSCLAPAVSISKAGAKKNQVTQSYTNTLCRCFFAVSWAWGRQKFARAARRKGECQLLADADALSVQHIRDAIALLQKMGWRVITSIFANPQRKKNKKWRALMKDDDIHFRPVERESGFDDTSDEVIISELRGLMDLEGSMCLGLLLNGDRDFVDVVQDVVAAGRKMIVIIPDNRGKMCIDSYEKTTAQVVKLPIQAEVSKVRATLLKSGKGMVEIVDSDSQMQLADTNEAWNILEGLGYDPSSDSLPTCITKCWFESNLGDICVYPRFFAINSFVSHVHESQRVQLHRNSRIQCFVLPLYGTIKPKDFKIKYGSTRAGNIWLGGGPFMLQDSADLVIRVLSKLGHFDRWNTDVDEAMFVFCTCAPNKQVLRKALLLPDVGWTSKEVSDSLRKALLVNHASTWQLPPRDTEVRKLLQRKGILGTTKASKHDTFQAMQKYGALHGMPSMKNYNSYVSRILAMMNKRDPNRREIYDGPCF